MKQEHYSPDYIKTQGEAFDIQKIAKEKLPANSKLSREDYQDASEEFYTAKNKQKNVATKNLARVRREIFGDKVLYENLGINENAEQKINQARKLIAESDPSGKSSEIFEQALEYYSSGHEIDAEVLIFHSTGSWALSKIIEHGAIDSSRNLMTGEKVTHGDTHGGTSLGVYGYDESDSVADYYARKNEKHSILSIDSKALLGDDVSVEALIVKAIFEQFPNLKPDEAQHVGKTVVGKSTKKLSADELIKDKEFFEGVVKSLKDRPGYYFNYHNKEVELDELYDELTKSRSSSEESDETKKWQMQQWAKIRNAEDVLKYYDNSTGEERELFDNPYGATLIFDGKDLPEEDLKTPKSGLICERQTKAPIFSANLKEIHAPISQIEQLKKWINERLNNLPKDTPEADALRKVKIIPFEFAEVKKIIQNIY
jgi:hypothetical protein